MNVCAAHCPAGKHCFPEDNAQSCVVGSARVDNAGNSCCVVDQNVMFLKTARDILAHAQAQAVLNPGTENVRSALTAFVNTMPQLSQNPSMFQGSRFTFIPWMLDEQQGEDLIQLLERVVPQTGYSVELEMADLRAQPLQRRRKPQNRYACNGVTLNELPHDALSLATNLEIHAMSSMEAYEVIVLVLRALNNPNQDNIRRRVTFQTNLPLNSEMRRTYIRQVKSAMRSSAFRGIIIVSFAGDVHTPISANVPRGVQHVPYPGANNANADLVLNVADFAIIVSMT